MAAPNKQWHETHKLAEGATPMEQVAWFEAHRRECDCRPIPPDILKMMPPASEQT